MDDEGNAPLVLPNGHVYGTRAIDEIAKNNGGVVVCPGSGERYGRHELRKAFIV